MPRFVEHDDVYVGGVKITTAGVSGATEDDVCAFDDSGVPKNTGIQYDTLMVLAVPAAAHSVAGLTEAGALEDTTLLTAKLLKVAAANDVVVHSADGAIATSGIALITGDTGIAGLTIAAPTPGCRCEIRVDSITSGDVVVTCAAEVTFDGTNDIATLDDAAEALVLGYKSATEWQIIENVGSVALSTTH